MGMFLYDNPECHSQPIGTVIVIEHSQENKAFNLLNDIIQCMSSLDVFNNWFLKRSFHWRDTSGVVITCRPSIPEASRS